MNASKCTQFQKQLCMCQLRTLWTALGVVVLMTIMGCDSNSSDRTRFYQEAELTTPPSDCLWAGGNILEYERFNFQFGDTNVAYWAAVYILPEEGAYVTFQHQFPHSRFTALTSYSSLGAWVDQLTDWEIIPAEGGINPFIEGSPRNDSFRWFTVSVKSGERPENSSIATENELYYGNTEVGGIVVLIYRNYLPDAGQDATGGVGLPRVTLHMADGSILQGEDACAVLGIGYEPNPSLMSPDVYAALRESTDPSHNPPLFRATYDRPFQIRCEFEGDCSNPPPRGALIFLNSNQVTMYSFLNRQYGEVAVLRGKIPKTPRTYNGDELFMNGELRYWAMCQNEYYSTKVKACLFDEAIQINSDGFYTIVTSRPEDRPSNATEECGVGFIPWSVEGDGFGIVEGRENNADDGYLLIRNVLPSPDFHHANQNTSVVGDEAEVLGEFLPKGQYFTKEEFEGLGCNPGPLLPYESM